MKIKAAIFRSFCRSSNGRRNVFVSHQGCVPIYRKSFYNRLNEIGFCRYVVVHGSAPRGSDLILAPLPYDFPNIKVDNRELDLLGRAWIWQPVVWRVIRGDFDAVVIGDEIKFISNLVIALVMLLRRRPVILWGFGYHQYTVVQESLLGRITARFANFLKRIMYRFASGYLVYTEGGQRALQGLTAPPKRIRVLRNTIDTENEIRLSALAGADPITKCCRELAVRTDSIKLLYFGRLIPAKSIDILINYARRCTNLNRNVDVIIFGHGSEEFNLRNLAKGLSNVTFHEHEDIKLARALRISAAVVVPGFLGLAVTHGFAHGVPTLTRQGQLHSPEIEYLEDNVNGLILPEKPEAFYLALDSFVDDRELQKRLSEGAKESAKSLAMNYMAQTFDALVRECLAAPTRPSAVQRTNLSAK
jgi:glycosyltransferase involved in cell wall biosynthesis